MITTHRHIRALLYLNAATFPSTSPSPSPSPKPFPLFHHHYPSPFSLPFCTNTSDSCSFPVSYLINTFGFSPKSASKLCSTYNLRFKTPQNPDSVLSFFKNRGFSDTQLHNMIEKAPWLLSCDPYKRVLPKLQFFLSKGASISYIINLVSKTPLVLAPSLENKIVPAYEFYCRFMRSDKATLDLLNHNPFLFTDHRIDSNIIVLIENGVTDSNIGLMLRMRRRSAVFNLYKKHDMVKLVEELKGLGFSPSKSTFATALVAKLSVPKTLWNMKVNAFKKWGWCDEDIMEAFRKQPQCMLASIDKINSLMSFWVNQLGWDALALVKGATVIGHNLERRIIPRAAVVQYLLEKGLRKKNASLTWPFTITNDLFLDRFVSRFKEESSYLLNMYEEKLNRSYTQDKTGLS